MAEWTDQERKIARLLRKRKVRLNVARWAVADFKAEDRTKPGPGSLSSSIVMTAHLRAHGPYRKALRRANWNDRLIRWGFRERRPGRPIEEILAEAKARREARGD